MPPVLAAAASFIAPMALEAGVSVVATLAMDQLLKPKAPPPPPEITGNDTGSDNSPGDTDHSV